MPWTQWFAFQHPTLTHLPLAVAVLLPFALAASMRAGRGIRPWWLVCRYLAWWGMVFLVLALVAGHFQGHQMHLAQGPLAPSGSPLRLHQLWGAGSLLAGALTLFTLHRRRLDHQSLGPLALFAGLVWSALLVQTGIQGNRLGRPVQVVEKTVTVAAPAPVAVPTPVVATPAPDGLTRILDYASLEPLHTQPVKTTVHGLRWIRAWITPSSAEAYRKGEPLPAGTLVVMSTLEDRWGRPSTDPGPLYALEIKADGKPELSFYWGRIPEAKRAEVGGAERAHWQGRDANLESCMSCHAQGMAPAKDRSKLLPFVKPKAE